MEVNQNNEVPVTVSETATGKSRMSKGQIIGMVILTIVALAGVAFGVFGMMEKDKAEKNLAIKITEAGGKVTEIVTDKITSVSDDGTVTEITDTNAQLANPVIVSSDSATRFYVNFTSPVITDGSTNENGQNAKQLRLSIIDGKINDCAIYSSEGNLLGDCSINGIDGNIYKVVHIGWGHAVTDEDKVGFIMEDGRVLYFTLFNILSSNNISIEGTLAIGGFVRDAFQIGAGDIERRTGYVTTIFVLSDGSIVDYASIK